MRLAGNSALITGASFGIGRASALRFAREGAEIDRVFAINVFALGAGASKGAVVMLAKALASTTRHEESE